MCGGFLMVWKESIANRIVQVIAGAIGGTAAGNTLKDLSMGEAGNAISGAVGRRRGGPDFDGRARRGGCS